MKNTVATIIVTYNRLELLKECIESLRSQIYKNHDIIVVNNGSTDNTLEWLSSQKDLTIINQANTGGAGGFFSGIKYACEHGYQYSWIMDDDVVADKAALFHLINSYDESCGFLCSRVLDTHGEMCNVPKVSVKKSKCTNEFIWGNQLDQYKLLVDIASFVSVFFNNKIVYQVGLPYQEYFIWGDDTEYTSRISRNHPSYMIINSLVIHKRKIRSTLSIFNENDKNRIKNYFYHFRNRIHLQPSFNRKILYFGYSIYEILVLLLKLNFYKAGIVTKALFSAFFFHPTIKYPKRNA